jgi:hypothetical protein
MPIAISAACLAAVLSRTRRITVDLLIKCSKYALAGPPVEHANQANPISVRWVLVRFRPGLSQFLSFCPVLFGSVDLGLSRHSQEYVIRVRFNNGREGDVDLSDALWGPVFEPLRDLSAFRRFRVSDVLHTIQWENGADLAPEFPPRNRGRMCRS